MTEFRAALAALLCLFFAMPAAAQENEPLIGLWAAELRFDQGRRGELEIRRRSGRWTASIAGAQASAAAGRELLFRFGENGGFRGRLARGDAIEGFWIQPAGALEDRRDPGGSGQSFATPMRLRRVSPGVWRGTVTPLEGRFTLWLSIFRTPEGDRKSVV